MYIFIIFSTVFSVKYHTKEQPCKDSNKQSNVEKEFLPQTMLIMIEFLYWSFSIDLLGHLLLFLNHP